MSETTSETTVEVTETETAEVEAPKQLKPTETVDFWKQKAREQEQRAKANAEAATRLKEFEDRDKSEQQKLSERAEAAEKRALDLESRSMRLEVAADKGLTPGQAKRLVGTTREELEADADEILRDFPIKPGRPQGDVDQGVRSNAQKVDESPRGLITAGLEQSSKK